MKRYLILLYVTCLSALTAFAQPAGQKIAIRGTVTSANDGEPLPSAYIFELDKDGRIVSNAASDYDGNYSMLVSSTSNKLSCQYVGFEKMEVTIGTRTVINLALEEKTTVLGDVEISAQRLVQTGMMQISERDVTSSVARLDAADIEELSAASIDDAIQGRMAGVDIVASSGDPGAGMSIRIRGTTSINSSNEPLIVVDGVVFETSVGDFDFANANEEEYSQLLNVATEDIENIVVLKDASATAIWGSKAANGVLQITTKRGKIGKPQVNYTFKGTLSHQPEAIPTLSGDQYTTMILESLLNSGTMMDMTSNPEFAYDTNNPYYYYNYSQNSDWIGAVTQLGHTQDHSVSISGGTSKVRYRFSSNYWDQVGTTIGTDYARITARMNLDYSVSEKLSFSANIAYVHGDQDKNYLTTVRSTSYTKMPNQSIYEYSESGQLSDVYFTPQTNQQGTYTGGNYNPLALAYDGLNNVLSEKITPKLNLTYRLLPHLTYMADVAFDLSNTKTKKFLPQTATGLDWTNVRTNLATDSDAESYSVQMYHKLYFKPDLGENHTLDFLAGTITSSSSSEGFSVTGSNTASALLMDPSAGSRVTSSVGDLSSSLSRARDMAVYAQAQYKYMDKYMLNVTVRTDGNSKFGENYRYGTFPAVSLRWRISDEPFMQWAADQLDELSFRSSYGVNGNTPKSNYLSYSNYTTYGYTYLGTTGTYVNNLQLNNLRWERVTQTNVAGNLIMFNNRLNADFDYYWKNSNDLLFSNLTIPSSSGFSQANYMNVGRMDNIGWELNVMTTPYKSKDLTVNFNFNVARSQNYIRSISEYVAMESGSWNTNGSYMTRYEIDQPIGSFYGYRYKGVYLNEEETIATDKYGNKIYTYDENNQRVPLYMKFGAGTSVDYQFEAGDAKYEDINHDGNIDQQDIVYLGNANPLFYGGFGPSINWKRRWVLSTHFNFRYGNDIVNSAKMNMEKMYNYNNQSTAVLRRWRHEYASAEEAPADLLPRALMGTGYNWLASDRFVEDGSFCRFRSLTLRYNFPKEIVKPWGLSNMSAYVTMQNIYVWTNYTGQDPEVTISALSLGYDNALAPRTKDYVLGLSITF